MQNGGFVNKIQGVRLSVAKIHRHVFENPGSKLDDRGCHGAPDWIIEIVSSGSRQMDYYKKAF